MSNKDDEDTTEVTERTTMQGFHSPLDGTGQPAPQSLGRGSGTEAHGVEVELVQEAGPPQLLQGAWRAVEVWTANTIYALDAGLVCQAVLDRSTYQSDPSHDAVGATMLGGQIRGPGGAIEAVSHPLPQVGARAVFSRAVGKRLSVSETSPVTRVVYRLRVVHVGPAGSLDWDQVSGTWPNR